MEGEARTHANCSQRLDAGWLRLHKMKAGGRKYLPCRKAERPEVGASIDHEARAEAPVPHAAQRDLDSLKSVGALVTDNAVGRLREDRLDDLLHARPQLSSRR